MLSFQLLVLSLSRYVLSRMNDSEVSETTQRYKKMHVVLNPSVRPAVSACILSELGKRENMRGNNSEQRLCSRQRKFTNAEKYVLSDKNVLFTYEKFLWRTQLHSSKDREMLHKNKTLAVSTISFTGLALVSSFSFGQNVNFVNIENPSRNKCSYYIKSWNSKYIPEVR